MSPDPGSSRPPDTDDSLARQDRGDERLADSPMGALLSQTLSAMYGAGDDAEEIYQDALTRLRENPEMALDEIARAENQTDPANYPDRLALIQLVGELQHSAALPFLSNLVLTPIPAERSTDPHSYSTVAEETILRTTAVEGVGRIAMEDSAAVESLMDFLKQPSLSVRRAAVQSILATSEGSKYRDRIAAMLPSEHQFLLDIKPMSVHDVDQINDPTQHLSAEALASTAKSPPNLRGDDPPAESSSESAPTIGKD